MLLPISVPLCLLWGIAWWWDSLASEVHTVLAGHSRYRPAAVGCEYPALAGGGGGLRAGLVGYSVLMVRRDAPGPGSVADCIYRCRTAMLAVTAAAYYGSLLRVSEGANNLPLLPAAHLLLYIVTMFVVVPPLLAISVREPATGDVAGAAICGALGILCVVMAPGALGRCDPPHVLFYGMGASMLLMVRLANISRPAFAVYTIAYAGVFIVLMQVVNLVVFYHVSPRELLSRHAIAHVAAKLRSHTGTERPDMATLSVLDRYPRLGLPFATFGDPAVETYMLSRGKLEPEVPHLRRRGLH